LGLPSADDKRAYNQGMVPFPEEAQAESKAGV